MKFDRKTWMREWFLQKWNDPEFRKKREETNARWRASPQRRKEAKIRVAKWREKHPGYGKEYFHKNAERLSAYNKQYLKDNPHKSREHRHRRVSRIKRSNPLDCSKRIAILLRRKFCYWCWGKFENKSHIQIDHVTPLAKGGRHTPRNLVASCRKCNASKRAKFYWQWDEELAS